MIEVYAREPEGVCGFLGAGQWAGTKINDVVSLRRMVGDYIAHGALKMSARTLQKYTGDKKRLEAFELDGVPVMDARAHQMSRGWAFRLRESWAEQRGSGSASELIKLLSASWEHAAKLDRVAQANPFRGLRQRSRKIEIVFDEGHIGRLQQLTEDARAEGVITPLIANMIQIASATGARPGEVYSLEWSAVTSSTILLCGKQGPRTIPRALLGERAEAALAEQREGRVGKWVFGSPRDQDRHVSDGAIGNVWGRLVEYFEEHGLRMRTVEGRRQTFRQATRHALGTLGVGELGLSAAQVAEILGNSEQVLMGHYAQMTTRHMVPTATKIREAIKMQTTQAEGLSNEFEHGVRRERLKELLDMLSEDQLSKLKGRRGRPLTANARARYVLEGENGRDVPISVLSQVSIMAAQASGISSGELLEWLIGHRDEITVARKLGGS